MPTTSTVEKVVADLITLFKGITTGAGYRNTVTKVVDVLLPDDKVSSADTPIISVLVGFESMESPDTVHKTFDSYLEVNVLGYVSATENVDGTSNLFTAAESLLHDMKKILAGFVLAHLNDSSKRYDVMLDKHDGERIVADRVMDVGQQKGIVALGFKVRIFAQDSSFGN